MTETMNEDLIAALQQHLFTTQEDIMQLREASKRLDAALYACRQKLRPGAKNSTAVLPPKPREKEAELRGLIDEIELEVAALRTLLLIISLTSFPLLCSMRPGLRIWWMKNLF